MSLKLKIKVLTKFLNIRQDGDYSIIEVETGSDEVSVQLNAERTNYETNRGLRAHFNERKNEIIIGTN